MGPPLSIGAGVLLLFFAVVAGAVAFVDALGSGEYLAALAFAVLTLIFAASVYLFLGVRRVREWWM